MGVYALIYSLCYIQVFRGAVLKLLSIITLWIAVVILELIHE